MDRFKRNCLIVSLVCFALVFAVSLSCIPQAGKGEAIKPLSEMMPKEKATWMMSVYSSQAKDYKRMVKVPNLTNEQKAILRNKKVVAQKLWPLINSYRTYVNAGAVPTQEVEAEIIGLINDLTILILPYITE